MDEDLGTLFGILRAGGPDADRILAMIATEVGGRRLVDALDRDEALELARDQLHGHRAEDPWSIPVAEEAMFLNPFAPEEGVGLIYGKPGSWKTILSQGLAISAVVDESIVPGVDRIGPPVPVLWIDAEASRMRVARRFQGFRDEAPRIVSSIDGRELIALWQVSLEAPLANRRELADMKAIAREVGATMVFLDSAGPASDGPLNDAETPRQLYGALGQIAPRALVMAHQPKWTTDGPTVFGSVFFTALARVVWHLKQQATGNGHGIVLHNDKMTDGELAPDIAFRIGWDSDPIVITAGTTLTLRERIGVELLDYPAGLTIAVLVAKLGEKTDAGIEKALQKGMDWFGSDGRKPASWSLVDPDAFNAHMEGMFR